MYTQCTHFWLLYDCCSYMHVCNLAMNSGMNSQYNWYTWHARSTAWSGSFVVKTNFCNIWLIINVHVVYMITCGGVYVVLHDKKYNNYAVQVNHANYCMYSLCK